MKSRQNKSRLSFYFLQVAFCILTLAAPILAADATLTLPLQGYYHSGHYMPVRVSAHSDSAGAIFTLHGTGALTTQIKAEGDTIDATVPWLSVRTIRDVSWSLASDDHPVDLPLHPLEDDERLIGYAGADADALASTFPGKKLIRVEINVADPLPGDVTAWESLDGIVLDSSAAARPSGSTFSALLSAGTAIAIRSTQKPGGDWPWKRQGAYWVMRADVAGPSSAYFPEAYLPEQAWTRGWPPTLRRQAIGAAVIFAILATAVTLWRSRWTAPAVVVLCAIAAALALGWRNHQSVVINVGGSVVIMTDSTTQRDQWTYHAVLRPAECRIPWQTMSRPVFGYRQQAQEIDARLQCAADGRPLAFAFRLQPRQSLAFVSRDLSPGRATILTTLPITSPLRGMADNFYAAVGDRMTGQTSGGDEQQWPGVVIARVDVSRH